MVLQEILKVGAETDRKQTPSRTDARSWILRHSCNRLDQSKHLWKSAFPRPRQLCTQFRERNLKLIQVVPEILSPLWPSCALIWVIS